MRFSSEYAQICWDAIEAHILPVLEEHSHRENLIENLMSQKRKNRIGDNPIEQYLAILCDAILRSDRSQYEEAEKHLKRLCLVPHHASLAGPIERLMSAHPLPERQDE